MFSTDRKPSVRRRLTAILGLELVVVLNVLAVWPEAHEFFHQVGRAATAKSPAEHRPESDDEDNCVVAAFAHGHVFSGSVALLAVLLGRPEAGAIMPEQMLALFSADRRLPPGCGPPSA